MAKNKTHDESEIESCRKILNLNKINVDNEK
jgi:hypothetical protein